MMMVSINSGIIKKLIINTLDSGPAALMTHESGYRREETRADILNIVIIVTSIMNILPVSDDTLKRKLN